MRFQTVSILTAASLASALTPQGFTPGSQNQLFVQYGNQAALNGQVIPRDCKFLSVSLPHRRIN
jgi:hypothetical protein